MELQISRLSKTYPNGVQALKDVSLNIGAGMFGLLGPNGAGKSTLMRTIATLQDADRGAIRLNDIDVLKEKEEVRKILGYLPQEFGVYPNMSALEMLDHLAIMKGILNSGQRRSVVEGFLQQTNLWDARKTKLGEFSGGMKQRFGIAQALLGDPQLVIVDEPTAGLDPTERNRFLNLLSSIGSKVIVILSTHIVDDVRELCPRMAIIHEGAVIAEGHPEDMIERLEGQIWRKALEDGELNSLEKQGLQIVSTHLVAGRTEVRVHSEAGPGNGFLPAEPQLRDAYFLSLAGCEQGGSD